MPPPARSRLPRWLRLGRRLLAGRLVHDLVEPPALREALEREAPAIAEGDVGDRAGEVADRLADEDLPALGVRSDPLRGVDRGAEGMAAALEHLADVEPDPDEDVLVGMLAAVRGQRLVDRDGAGDRAPRRQERDHEAVADRVDLAAAVLGERLAHDALVVLDRLPAPPRRRAGGSGRSSPRRR